MEQQLNLSSVDYERKKLIYDRLFSFGTNTGFSVDDKFDFLRNICFLTFKLRELGKISLNASSLEVFEMILNQKINRGTDASSEENFLIDVSFIVDDLLYGCTKITPPANTTNSQEIIKNIKTYLETWIPF